MKKQIKRISIMQTSKVVALIYPIFGLIHTAIGIWLIPPSEGTNFIRTLLICMPIIIGIFGFVFTAIGCLLYNFVASKVGGIEFVLEDVEPAYLENAESE